MPITVNSPYSGRPVKVRDQDINRAVRDEEDRIFYVVPRASGEGYYAAPTRKGSAKDEARYDSMQGKMDQAQQEVARQHVAAHDATGRPRKRTLGRFIVLVLLVAALVVAGYAAYVVFGGGEWPDLFGAPDNPLSPLPTDNPTDLPTPQILLRQE